MKITSKISTLVSGILISLMAMMLGVAGNASAASAAQCLYQYNQNGFPTSSTPVFNSICGVNQGIGNEPDFVRIRQSTNGVVTDNTNNPNYSIGNISSACNAGDKYDLWNYVHNDAMPADNPDQGSGSAVAHNTAIQMTAPLGTTSNKFTFGATISASNAASVSDSANLNCNGQPVTLSIVPGSVHIYSQPYGAWQTLPDGSVNSTLPLGSTNAGLPSMGQGDMWGCWTYRIVIVYQVTVTPTPPAKTPPTCNLLQFENQGNVARIDNIEYTANDAKVTGFSLDITDNGTTTTQQIALNSFPKSYPIVAGHTYTYKATVLSDLGNVTSAKCVAVVTPTTTPPVTPPVTPPTALVNTGPGSVVAIFVGATAFGTVAYNWFLKKKISKNS
ncbi:MAG TPA: hypothetical protein VIH90_03880 [Candidatus Saccharimonadales bacterium]